VHYLPEEIPALPGFPAYFLTAMAGVGMSEVHTAIEPDFSKPQREGSSAQKLCSKFG
jgi:hypothetical protein